MSSSVAVGVSCLIDPFEKGLTCVKSPDCKSPWLVIVGGEGLDTQGLVRESEQGYSFGMGS